MNTDNRMQKETFSLFVHLNCRGDRDSLAQKASWYCVPFTYLWQKKQ